MSLSDWPDNFYDEFADDFVDAQLVSRTPGTPTAGALTAGDNSVETTHACKALVSVYRTTEIDGTVVKRGDRRVRILAKSIEPAAVPKPDDDVVVAGETLTIVGDVSRDPASVAYLCQGRP